MRRYGASHGSHAHGHFQILVGLDGALDLEIEGRGLRLGVGESVVIAPDDRHDFESRAGAHCLVLDSANAAWRCAIGRPISPADLMPLARYLSSACALSRPQAHHLSHAPVALSTGNTWRPGRKARLGCPRWANSRRACI